MSVVKDEGGRAAELSVYDSKPLEGKITHSQMQDCSPTTPAAHPASDPATTISVAAATTHFLMTLLREWGMKPQPKEPC